MVNNSAFWHSLEARFRALPDPKQGLTATFGAGQWTVVSPGLSDELHRKRLRKSFCELATAGAIAAGAPNGPTAHHYWLDLLRKESPHFYLVDSDDGGGWIENLALASAEYCITRAVRAFQLEAATEIRGTSNPHPDAEALADSSQVDDPPFRQGAKQHPHLYAQWFSLQKLWVLYELPPTEQGRRDLRQPVLANPEATRFFEHSVRIAVGRLRQSSNPEIRALAISLRKSLSIWLDLMRAKERGFQQTAQLTRWRGGESAEEFMESGALPPDARLTGNGKIPQLFQESAAFWDDLVDLGFHSEAAPIVARQPVAPARQPPEPALLIDEGPDVVPQSAADLHTREQAQESNPDDGTFEAQFSPAVTAKRFRALTVARLIKELDDLKPQMFEDEVEYERLRAQYAAFLTFRIADGRPDLKTKVLAIRFSARHIRLAQELAAAHHGRQLATIQDDWKAHKPAEFKRGK